MNENNLFFTFRARKLGRLMVGRVKAYIIYLTV